MQMTIGITAIIFYTITMILSCVDKFSANKKILVFFILLAVIFHSILLWQLVILNWVNLGFFHSLSFASLLIILILLINFNWHILSSMLIVVLPIVILSIALEILNPEIYYHKASASLDIHISFSILSYSFLSIAGVLALFLFIQERLLKQKKLLGFIEKLPALEITEKTLFKIIWFGFILLSFSLLTGFFFMENILAQGLSHKIFFSILSWLVFVVLLLGRLKYGWRGVLATKLTLIGFVFVVLGYLGSKLVYEFIL